MGICDLTALEIGAAVKNKEIGVKEAVSAFFSRIEASELNAYITTCRKEAEARADEAQRLIDAGELVSPLAGVPVAVKDNICTKGIRTTCASKILGGFVPPYDAAAVERLNAAGCVVLGKLNMDEFAMGCTNETSYFGAVKNPVDTAKSPGGSSGGSAAAVAAKEAPIALGSDTGGSVRQPAAWCGITGFKPTYGTVSRYGLIAYASSLDQIGALGRTADDCAALIDVLRGSDKRDATSLASREAAYLGEKLDLKDVKIGLPRECFGGGVEADTRDSVLKMAETLEKHGAAVDWINLPFIDYCVHAYYIIAAAEASSNLSRFDGVKYGFRAEGELPLSELYAKTRGEGFGKEVKKRVLLGAFALSSGYYDDYYIKAIKTQNLIKRRFGEVFEEFDFIICPTSPHTAQDLFDKSGDPLKNYLSDIFTVSANLAGLPAISVPCGADRGGLPVGGQIMGKRFDDARVLALGKIYQEIVGTGGAYK